MSNLKIKANAEEEAKNLPSLVKLAGASILISSIRNIYWKVNRKELCIAIENLHSANKEKIVKIVKYYEVFWERTKKDYIKELKKIMGDDLNENKVFYISPSLWVNIADVTGRRNAFIVASEVQQNSLEFIFLHELTHLHYADFLKNSKIKEAGKSSLMEGVAHLILFKSLIKNLFSGIKYSEVVFVKKNSEFMKKLEKLWDNRENFKSFLEEAIKLNKKMKGVVIC